MDARRSNLLAHILAIFMPRISVQLCIPLLGGVKSTQGSRAVVDYIL
jgi:hypothetical protein